MHIQKKQRIETYTLKDLVDIKLQLWRDLFSIFFQFSEDKEFLQFMLTSKSMFELVKERAVFHEKRSYFTFLDPLVDKRKRKFSDFYFSRIKVHGFLENEMYQETAFFRQRFVLLVSFAHCNDLLVLCRKNERGNMLFPNLRYVHFQRQWQGEKIGTFKNNFWKFLQEFPRRISFNCGDSFSFTSPLPPPLMTRLVTTGAFHELDIYHENIASYTPAEFSLFSKMNTRWVRLARCQDFVVFGKLMHVLKDNQTLQRIELEGTGPECYVRDLTPFVRFVDMFLDPENFPNVKTIEIVEMPYYEALGIQFERLAQREGLDRIIIEHYIKGVENVDAFVKFCANASILLKRKIRYGYHSYIVSEGYSEKVKGFFDDRFVSIK